MQEFLLFLFVLFSITNIFIIIAIVSLRDEIRGETQEEKPSILTSLTSYERERLERESAFETRIAKLKQEVADYHPHTRPSTTAEELHPEVYNIPHELIREKPDIYPDVEYIK